MKVKRLLCALFALVLACSLAGPALADVALEPWWGSAYDVDYYVYIASQNGKGLTPHDGPGSNYFAYDQTIPDGTRVHIIQECTSDYGNKWGYMDYNKSGGYWGWIYLPDTSSDPMETWDVDYTAWILTDDGTGLNIRSGPGTGYDKIDGLIPDGTRLHVLKEGRVGKGSTWGYVEYNNGKRGWLTLKFVTKTPPADAEAAPAPDPMPTLTVHNPIPAAATATPQPQAEAPLHDEPLPVPATEDPASSGEDVFPAFSDQIPVISPIITEEQQEKSSSDHSVLIAVIILGASILCLSLAALLLILTVKKKKKQP